MTRLFTFTAVAAILASVGLSAQLRGRDVTDLDASCAELHRLGIANLSPPAAMAMGPGLPDLRFVCCRGPDGEVLERLLTIDGRDDLKALGVEDVQKRVPHLFVIFGDEHDQRLRVHERA